MTDTPARLERWDEWVRGDLWREVHELFNQVHEAPREGKVYCAVVLDVFSRRIVGWSIDSSPTSGLVTSALGMAIGNRRPNGTVIHSDQGTQQFTSWAFTHRAR